MFNVQNAKQLLSYWCLSGYLQKQKQFESIYAGNMSNINKGISLWPEQHLNCQQMETNLTAIDADSSPDFELDVHFESSTIKKNDDLEDINIIDQFLQDIETILLNNCAGQSDLHINYGDDG